MAISYARHFATICSCKNNNNQLRNFHSNYCCTSSMPYCSKQFVTFQDPYPTALRAAKIGGWYAMMRSTFLVIASLTTLVVKSLHRRMLFTGFSLAAYRPDPTSRPILSQDSPNNFGRSHPFKAFCTNSNVPFPILITGT